ncbi:phage tail protein [Amycolatopsis sp. NBC_01488]|uniref:phage tail protein n=1 Tax=Amycolatopsis sp. NBC_01488 TaxID=2903563 RepID=UPI002E2D96B8|nr:phage tail protein [Amycolatopsis sp. NBC_01488]
MAALLPAVLQEDPVLTGLTTGLDEVLAPAYVALDCLDAYLDPGLAPADFLARLAAWLGVTLDESWADDQRREVVRHAVELHGMRGTARGLRWQLELAIQGRAEVVDSGSARWSSTPTSPAPVEPSLVVRIRRGSMSDTELAAVRDLVAGAKPAHVPHRIELVG